MVLLIAGSTHTGKTRLAQRLLETRHWPYLSLDHLKMGLIRSGQTPLTPEDDDALTAYLWPIAREIIKTVLENGQDLIVEGCYIPFDYARDFSEDYRRQLHYLCLVFSPQYIRDRYEDILRYENVVERRLESDCSAAQLLADNEEALRQCRLRGERYVLIDDCYAVVDATVDALLADILL